MDQKNRCPVCDSSIITDFLRRKKVPVHQNLVVKSQEHAMRITRGNLDLMICKECGFIFNQSFDLNKLSYGVDYDNTQEYSTLFKEYLASLVRHLISEKSVQKCRIVEIGCGKGSFLRMLVENMDTGNVGIGFDPSYTGPSSDLGGRLKFKNCYYGPECSRIPADVVICRHVIEHVPDPLALLRMIRSTLVSSIHARVFFETPSVEWILSNQVIWDFFYEHCSYFSVDSLTTAFELAGFSVEGVQEIFCGQYLWLEATVSSKRLNTQKKPEPIILLAQEFAESEIKIKSFFKNKIFNILSEGKIAIWGAGAKGVTFANLVDPARKWIDCVVDLNQKKQGYYIPGTGHPIISYKELPKRGVTTAILMNPNYKDEIQTLLKEAHLNTKLVEIE